MANKSGKIVSIETKMAKTRYGEKPVYSVALEDGTSVEVGFKNPYQTGEYFNRSVEFKYGTWKDVGPAVAGAEVATPSPAARPAAGGAPSGRTFPVSRESPEMSIIRQNALTNAREVLVCLYGNGDDAYPGMPKAERQQYLDALAEDIFHLAYKFADFSSGQREVARAAEMAKMNPPSV